MSPACPPARASHPQTRPCDQCHDDEHHNDGRDNPSASLGTTGPRVCAAICPDICPMLRHSALPSCQDTFHCATPRAATATNPANSSAVCGFVIMELATILPAVRYAGSSPYCVPRRRVRPWRGKQGDYGSSITSIPSLPPIPAMAAHVRGGAGNSRDMAGMGRGRACTADRHALPHANRGCDGGNMADLVAGNLDDP